ncbi:hypothetical protein V9L20_01110 [Variovorax sp. CCNWLW225]|uniref:hypothetical protein n=1 Tax=Variovorax sp. CCNWLW225 TaxID=3127462 RepID=UPI003078A250
MGRAFTRLGILATTAYGAMLAYLIHQRWGALIRLPLNELGDFLAGAFGPLAILWLVLGYFQQGIELRQNSAALRLQAKELANSVEQQKELVAVAQKQHATDVEALNKQIERHEQERAEMLRAALPNLMVRVRRLPVNIRGAQFALEVYNAGAPCMDFWLSLEGAPGKPIIREMGLLQSGANVRAEFAKPIPSEPQEVALLMRYVTLHGDRPVLRGAITFGTTPEGDLKAIYTKTLGIEDV